MKKTLVVGALALSSLCGGAAERIRTPKGLAKGELDRGGLTFDFRAISGRRFEQGFLSKADDPSNLIREDATLPNGYGTWHSLASVNVLPERLPPDSPYRMGAGRFATFSRADGVLSSHLGPEFGDFCVTSGVDRLYCRAERTWRKYVRLPDDKGGNYRLSLRFRVRYLLPQDNTFALVIVHSWKLKPDGKGYDHVSRIGHCSLAGGYYDWTPTYYDFEVPAGADIVSVQFRQDGVGDLHCKDAFLGRRQPAAVEDPIAIRLSPGQLLDGSFAVGAGQCVHATWEWRTAADGAFDPDDTSFVLKLSSGFAFLGDAFAADAKEVKAEDGSSRITFTVKNRKFFPGGNFQMWDKPAMLIASTGAAGTEGTMSLEAWRNGRKIGDSGSVRLLTIPTVRADDSPRRYICAAMPGSGRTLDFRQPEACARYARHLAEIGIRLLAAECPGWSTFEHADTYRREFRAAGGRYLVATSTLKNVYHVEDGRDMPAEDKFVAGPDLLPHWTHYVKRDSVCPLTVIEERPTFLNRILPPIRKLAEGFDGVRANWEPFMYVQQGCFCDRCRAKFAKFVSADEGELKTDWPRIATAGGKYAQQWRRFRSLEHAEMIRVLDRHVKSWTGGEKSLGFIPAITWREVNSAWRDNHPSPESEPYDYGSFITTIGSWGPYVIWDAAKPYCYVKRLPLNHFVAAKDMREQTDRDYPAPNRPNLFGGTQGIQCGEWITEPEWLEMALDAYFFNGFESTQAYSFPEGLDARFEAAYARSATRAAKFEAAVRGGRRDDGCVELKPVREYALPSTTVTDYLPKYRNVPMLQRTVHVKDGVRTVAVFNFWEWGEAFFNLLAKDLPDGEYVIVDETGVLYARDAETASWSAGELAAGVQLQVGSSRTHVFEIRPAGAGALDGVRRVLTAAEMAAAYEEAKSRLRKAAAEDADYEASEGGAGSRDKKAEI